MRSEAVVLREGCRREGGERGERMEYRGFMITTVQTGRRGEYVYAKIRPVAGGEHSARLKWETGRWGSDEAAVKEAQLQINERVFGVVRQTA